MRAEGRRGALTWRGWLGPAARAFAHSLGRGEGDGTGGAGGGRAGGARVSGAGGGSGTGGGEEERAGAGGRDGGGGRRARAAGRGCDSCSCGGGLGGSGRGSWRAGRFQPRLDPETISALPFPPPRRPPLTQQHQRGRGQHGSAQRRCSRTIESSQMASTWSRLGDRAPPLRRRRGAPFRLCAA